MARSLTRRGFLKLACGALGASTLAACAPAPTPTPTPRPTEAKAPTTVPAAATTAPTKAAATAAPTAVPLTAAPQVAGEVVVWHIWSGGRLPLMDDIIKRFNEQHPKIKAKHEFVSGGSAQLLQKLQTSIAAGKSCDVAMTMHYWVPAFAIRKSLLALDDLIAAHGVRTDVFFPYALAPGRWDGKLYVLPADGSPTPLLLYNTDHYAEAKVSAPPKTWDDAIASAKALTRVKGKDIERLGFGFGSFNIQLLAYLTHSNNGKLISDDGRKYLFNSPEAVEAMEFVVRLVKEACGSSKAYQDFMAMQKELKIDSPFMAGTCSQSLEGPWQVGLIETGSFKDLHYDTAVPPHSSKGQTHAVYMGSWSYGIPAVAANKEASWELLEWLTVEPTAAGWFMREQLRVPALKATMSDPKYTQYKQWKGIVAQTETAVGVPATPVMQETVNKVATAMEAALMGDQTPKAALDKVQAETQKLLDDFYAKPS